MQRLKEQEGEGGAYQYAQIHAQWGEPEAAMKWLEKAVELKDPGLIEMKADPLLDPLRNVDQFKDLVAAQHFPTAAS